MKIKVKWVGGVAFSGESPAGHSVIMDGPSDHGGKDAGFRPMEMILLGIGGCSSFDVIDILSKGRQIVSNCEVNIQADRVDAVPSVFSKIRLDFKVSGDALNEHLVKRAIKLSVEKYCSAITMLERGGVSVEHDYEIVSTS